MGLPLPAPPGWLGLRHKPPAVCLAGGCALAMPTCIDSHRHVCLRTQAPDRAVLDAARVGDLPALERLLGENPALANCADQVRGPSVAC